MGRFGESLAKSLYKLGHEVLAVDSDPELVNAIAPYVTQAVQIDAEHVGVHRGGGVADDLLSLSGMDKPLAGQLASHGIKDRDALADLSVDELMEMTQMDQEQAMQLITTARAHWFE